MTILFLCLGIVAPASAGTEKDTGQDNSDYDTVEPYAIVTFDLPQEDPLLADIPGIEDYLDKDDIEQGQEWFDRYLGAVEEAVAVVGDEQVDLYVSGSVGGVYVQYRVDDCGTWTSETVTSKGDPRLVATDGLAFPAMDFVISDFEPVYIDWNEVLHVAVVGTAAATGGAVGNAVGGVVGGVIGEIFWQYYSSSNTVSSPDDNNGDDDDQARPADGEEEDNEGLRPPECPEFPEMTTGTCAEECADPLTRAIMFGALDEDACLEECCALNPTEVGC